MERFQNSEEVESLKERNLKFKKQCIIGINVYKASLGELKSATPRLTRIEAGRALPLVLASHAFVSYLDSLKAHLIKEANITDSIFLDPCAFPRFNEHDKLDGFSNVLLDTLGSYHVSTAILIGPEVSNPRDGQWSAKQLKDKFNAFGDSLGEWTGRQKHYTKFRTHDIYSHCDTISGVVEGWETGQFYHWPLIEVLQKLTQLQITIRVVEVEAIGIIRERENAIKH